MNVTKAIFPAAGLGTRFLPATKAQPKEMLPLVDRPLIQYAVEEAVASGIRQIFMVTGRSKRAIVEHFDPAFELEHYLTERGQIELLDRLLSVERLRESADISYIHQRAPLGLGHAVWTARRLVANEPCAVVLADDIILGPNPCLAQMFAVYERYKCPVLATRAVAHDQVSRYGIIAVGDCDGNVHQVRDMVEKPQVDAAPSNFAILGRYVLTPEVLEQLSHTQKGTGGEIQLTDAIKACLHCGPVVALEFEGDYYDTGTVAGHLKANIALALKSSELRSELLEYLRQLFAEQDQSLL